MLYIVSVLCHAFGPRATGEEDRDSGCGDPPGRFARSQKQEAAFRVIDFSRKRVYKRTESKREKALMVYRALYF